jgi:hypothetical protein
MRKQIFSCGLGIIPKWGLSHQELIDWLRDELEAAKEYAEEDLRGGEQ